MPLGRRPPCCPFSRGDFCDACPIADREMKSDLSPDVCSVCLSRCLGGGSDRRANIDLTNGVKGDGETEVFCALIGVNVPIMQVNLCGRDRLSVCLILTHTQK